MKKIIFSILVVLLVLISYFVFISNDNTEVSNNTASPTPYTFSQDRLYDLVQSWRKEQGLTEYVKDERLCKIATDRADDPFDHKGLYEKYSKTNLIPLGAEISENLALYKDVNENDVLYSWLQSRSHREALEKPYTYSCIICLDQCVQIFGNLDI